MNTIGTVCNLGILTHYYCRVGRCENYDAPAVQDGIQKLVDAGMLRQVLDGLEVTVMGRFYVEHLLSVPFPVVTYSIPKDGDAPRT